MNIFADSINQMPNGYGESLFLQVFSFVSGDTYDNTQSHLVANIVNSEKVEFVIKDTGEIQKVIMYDQPIIQAIKTGDSSKLNYFIMLGALSGICIFLCRKRDVKSPKSK